MTPSARKTFLNQLSQSGNVTIAAESIRMSRARLYRIKRGNPRLSKAWDEAVEEACDRLEQEALRRAVDGYKRPIYQKGMLVGHEIMYSDKLLQFLLTGNKPAKFRRQIGISQGSGGPLQFSGDLDGELVNRITKLIESRRRTKSDK